MKNLKNVMKIISLAIVLCFHALNSSQEVKNAEMAVEQVDNKMLLLEQIMQQVQIVVASEDKTIRLQAKKELNRLMKHKDLDATIKKAIEPDIKIIKNPLTRSELDAAYQRLVVTYNKINAQANVVETIAQATEKVEKASPEELEETIAKVKQEIEEAQQQEQGFLGRMYSKAKRFVTAPVDYVFGKEASYAKTAFYAAVGLAVLAAGKHVYETYGKKDVFGVKTNDASNFIISGEQIRIPSEQGLAELKKLGDTLELQEEAIHQQLNFLAGKQDQLGKRNEFLSQEYTKKTQHKKEVKKGKRWYFGSVEKLQEDIDNIQGQYTLNEQRQQKIDRKKYHLADLLKQLETVKKNPNEYGYPLSNTNETLRVTEQKMVGDKPLEIISPLDQLRNLKIEYYGKDKEFTKLQSQDTEDEHDYKKFREAREHLDDLQGKVKTLENKLLEANVIDKKYLANMNEEIEAEYDKKPRKPVSAKAEESDVKMSQQSVPAHEITESKNEQTENSDRNAESEETISQKGFRGPLEQFMEQELEEYLF